MRLLQVIQELAPGGAERVVASVAAAARARGDVVGVAAAPGPWVDEVRAEAHFELPVLARRPAALPQAVLALRAAMRAFRPDVLHVHNPGMALVAGAATLRGRRVPALVSMHGVPEADYPAAARALRLAGLPVVGCGPGVSVALQDGGVTVRGTVVNGITPPPPAVPQARLRAELGLPEHGPLVVAVGRLAPQKNQALAIRAVATLPGACLAIVGGGPLERELRSEIQACGAAERMVLAGPRDDARAVLAAADAAVLPSRWEGLPLVALEALSAGVPLVATAVRGIRELVQHEREALLVPDGDEAALTEAIRRVLHDRELAARLSDAGGRLASRHSERAMTSAYLRLLDGLVAG